jgi:hypothetical protein
MPTTWELKSELKTLTFGLPRVATTGLRKDQIEGLVAYYRTKSKEVAPFMNRPLAKTGPAGPREVPVDDEEVDGLTIGVPKAPAPRLNRPAPYPPGDPRKKPAGPGRPKRKPEGEEAEVKSPRGRPAPPAEADDGVAVPLIRTKSDKVYFCRGGCGCPNCSSKKQ